VDGLLETESHGHIEYKYDYGTITNYIHFSLYILSANNDLTDSYA